MIFDLPFEPEEEDTNSVFSPYDSDDDFEATNSHTPALLTGNRSDAIPIPTSHLGLGNVIGTPSSFPGDDSTPSSASDSPVMTPKSQAMSSSEALQLEEAAMGPILPPSMYGSLPSENLSPPVSQPESKSNMPLSHKPRMAPASPPLPQSSHRRPATAVSANGYNQSPISTSPSSQGIWHKIRTNVRRPSFRANNESPPQPSSLLSARAMIKSGNGSNKADVFASRHQDPIAVAVPDKKEQSGVGRFANKGKQLYRQSSRTFQAVGKVSACGIKLDNRLNPILLSFQAE